ncbi:MAG: flagellar M-ring protein FliF [Gammaproteobacteria bacterium]|nr:flagellar M-ring protein FliF [Gammaproteobacteria bacterium]
MAAVEAEVLRSRLDGEGANAGVTVTTTRDATRSAGLVVVPGAPADQLPPPPDGPVAAFLKRPGVRTALPYVGLALVLLLAVVAYISLSTPPPRALYPEMADSDKEAAQQLLEKNGIAVELDRTTGSLTVPAAEFHEARIMLAAAGLPKDSSAGPSMLNETMPLGTSQFMEQARYNATVEEELAQSIRRINSIKDARVHLALPRQSAFVRDRADPKASVIVTPYAGRAVSDGQVQAIIHLVSSSIPYMVPANVSVVDQFGRLLTEPVGAKDLNAKQLELRQKLEADYVDRINQILIPIFGAANVRAQVNADLDFSVIEQTTENYDPQNAGTRVRSEQVKESRTTEPSATGVPGTLSNEPPAPVAATAAASLPPAAGAAPGAAGANATGTPNAAGTTAVTEPVIRGQERSETRNFEIDRSVRYVVDPAPRMRRLTVGVAINDAIAAPGAAAPPARRPLPAAELTRLTNLVQGTVGFDATRGDVVNIISTSFEAPIPPVELPIYLRPQVLDAAKYLAVALAIALVGLLIVRPIIRKITYIPPPPATVQAAGSAPPELAAPTAAGEGTGGATGPASPDAGASTEGEVELREGETLEELKARMKPKKKGISADLLDTANSYDDKVTVVRMLVSQDSKRVALVLKNLIGRDLS